MKKITLHVAMLTLILILGLSGLARADYTWSDYGGHEYALTENPGTWTSKEAEAVLAGGYLVTINSPEEESWLRSTFGTDRFWIGFNQIPGSSEPDGGWVWTSGEPVTYIHWAPGEPNNMWAPGEDKGVMNWASDGGWNDMLNDTDEFRGHGIIERNTVVPLPSALLLLGSGLLGLGAVGWRRRRC